VQLAGCPKIVASASKTHNHTAGTRSHTLTTRPSNTWKLAPFSRSDQLPPLLFLTNDKKKSPKFFFFLPTGFLKFSGSQDPHQWFLIGAEQNVGRHGIDVSNKPTFSTLARMWVLKKDKQLEEFISSDLVVIEAR
jgi:hypothetical protein